MVKIYRLYALVLQTLNFHSALKTPKTRNLKAHTTDRRGT